MKGKLRTELKFRTSYIYTSVFTKLSFFLSRTGSFISYPFLPKSAQLFFNTFDL